MKRYFKKDIFLFIWKTELLSERERLRVREISYPPVRSPNVTVVRAGPGWLGACSSGWISMMVAGTQGLQPCAAAFPGTWAGSWGSHGAARLEAEGDAGIAGSSFICCATMPALWINIFDGCKNMKSSTPLLSCPLDFALSIKIS